MLIKDHPIASIIIPCRNEKRYIAKCLDYIVDNDYPKDKLEVLVIDGISNDGTREIIKKYANSYSFIQLLDNYKKIVPSAMNIGIKKAKGNVIIRMDAHSGYPKDYISKIVLWLIKSDADNVGGIWITLPCTETTNAQAIAYALSSPFGVGNAMFRIGVKEPTFVDTVPYGAYRKEVFEKVGLFDEDMVRNQDDEFNLRLIKNGGKILLVPEIVSYYYPRDSLSKLWRMYYQYGYFKPLVALKVGKVLTWRQFIPAAFISILTISGILAILFKPSGWFFLFLLLMYSLTNIGISSSIAFKKGFKYLLVLSITFATLHFSYGFGYLKGIWEFVILRKNKRNKIKDIPLTR
jgi:glycosyltransferase involved in cell wall biosynthesis